MLQLLLKFAFILLLSAGIIYGIHIFVLIYFFPEGSLDLLNFSYKFNVGITLLFTSTIILASEHLKEQLGFIFLISGFIKLGVFLFLIKTSEYTLDKSVFLHFFIPYVLCVILEIVYVAKLLNKANFTKDK